MKKLVYTIVAFVLVAATSFKVSAQSEESRSVSGFNGVGSAGPFEVHVKIDGTESLKIKASQEAIKEIETYVKDGKLQIKFKHRDYSNDNNFGRIDIYVTAKSVSSIANADSVLFMWATFPCLLEALALGKAWGFTYKTVAFVWVKRNQHNHDLSVGMGYYTSANAEIVLLFTKGRRGM